MNGKGDTPRPIAVPPAVYDTNWERTFGRREPTEDEIEDARLDELERRRQMTNDFVIDDHEE